MALPSSRLRTTVSVESTTKDGSMKKLIFHNIQNFTRIEKLKIVLFVRLMEQETVDCFCGWCWGEQARWINRCDQSSNEKYELKSGFGNLIVESLLLFCKINATCVTCTLACAERNTKDDTYCARWSLQVCRLLCASGKIVLYQKLATRCIVLETLHVSRGSLLSSELIFRDLIYSATLLLSSHFFRLTFIYEQTWEQCRILLNFQFDFSIPRRVFHIRANSKIVVLFKY